MTWIPPTSRDQVLQDVIDEADRRLDGQVPTDVPGVEHTFRDARTLVDVLHVRWIATLTQQVDLALTELPDEPERAVVRAWRRAARELPGTRMILDRAMESSGGRDRERLERRARRQRQWLAQRAGLAPVSRRPDDEAVEAGARLEEAGRRYFEPHRRRTRTTLVQKLRAAVAV